VSIHSPLTEDTRGMFDADAFDAMKDDAALINVARGPIVDEGALLDALEDDSIEAAGLDVFDSEPPAADSPLRDHPDVVTTPHVAWYSEEANDQRRHEAAQCVREALADETPDNVIVGPDDAA
jgi:D-3-phosphoglycerate dehydrogenase